MSSVETIIIDEEADVYTPSTEEVKEAAKKVLDSQPNDRVNLDAYDKARLAISRMNKMAVEDEMPQDILAYFYMATSVTDGLLAVADAVYAKSNVIRS